MDNQIILDLINRDVDELKQILNDNEKKLLSNSTMVRLALLKAKSLCEELQMLADKTETLGSFNIEENEYFVDDEAYHENETVNNIKEEIENTPSVEDNEPPLIPEEVMEEIEKEMEAEFDGDEVFETLDEEVYVDEEDPIIEDESKKVIGENFEQKISLNDKFSNTAQEKPVINTKISDLKAAIGLNDKFLYTRELFENDSEKFTEAINKLNEAPTIDEAITYLENNFQWTKSETSIKFLDLVKRRFQN